MAPMIGRLNQYTTVAGMTTDRGNRNARRKPSPLSPCPPQMPHDLTWDRNQPAAMGNWRLSALPCPGFSLGTDHSE
jgi:hypothetical protein